MDNSFCIALGAVVMTTSLQPSAQFTMVVNLPVVNNPKIFVFIRNRLLVGLHVNNAEPAHGQSNVSFDEKSLVVRSAVHDLPVHPDQRVTLHLLPVVGIENSANSAHGL